MEFKRYYVPGSVEAGTPVVSHLRVRRATKRWFASPTVIEQGAAAGYFSVANGQLTIKTKEGDPDVVYKIVSPPGWYCCHCGQALSDSREGAAHISELHAGVRSPDDNNPSGWRRDNHYTLELVSGIEPKPEVGALGRLRYLGQQEDRRGAARLKIEERDKRLKAEAEARAAATPPSA